MSSPLNLEDWSVGDAADIDRDVPDIVVTDPLVLAWLTFKVNMSDPDTAIVLSKQITPTLGAAGHIVQDGSASQGNGTATVWFRLSAADTLLLGAEVRYYWDIRVKSLASNPYTTVDSVTGRSVGRLKLRRPVRLATP